MTLAACLATEQVAEGVSARPPIANNSNNNTKDDGGGVALPLMHGPTFMGNPLACAVAIESLTVLLERPQTPEETESTTSTRAHDKDHHQDNLLPFYQRNVPRIEARLRKALSKAIETTPDNVLAEKIADVRVRGAIGVIERKEPLSSAADIVAVAQTCLEHGAWLRPFGRLDYTMPPCIATDDDIDKIVETMMAVTTL